MACTFLLTLFGACSLATPLHKVYSVHEVRESNVGASVKRDAFDSNIILPMRVGLKQSNLHMGDQWLMEVSDPSSPKYGKYYSPNEVHDLFAPSSESVAAVRSWLEDEGVPAEDVSLSTNKQWLQFDIPAAKAESLLRTKYHIYEHPQTGRRSVGCDSYSVHESVRSHIDYITPGVTPLHLKKEEPTNTKRMSKGLDGHWYGPSIKPLSMAPARVASLEANSDLASCGATITPKCIFALYNLTEGTTAHPNNQLGIFQSLGQYLDSQDLNDYFATLYPRIPKGTFPQVKGIDGGMNINDRASAGIEAILDFEISYPLIWPQKSILFNVDDQVYQRSYSFPGFLNTFLDGIDGSYCSYTAFGESGNTTADPPYPNPAPGGYKGQLQCGVYKPTNVISISYGEPETGGVTTGYAQRQCSEYLKLGLQGVSVVKSSGDAGVGTPNGCLGPNKNVFSPDYPASCPYVTTVGGTTLPPGASAARDEEIATTEFQSGGGFSNIFPMPTYQKGAVEAFFRGRNAPNYPYYNGSTYGNGIYNRTGRGYPDVAAVAQNIVNVIFGNTALLGGTSGAAPIFASILTRINEERLAVGYPPVGFVNPTLYAHPEAFHDITVGSNAACGTGGFSAGKGWDPVTGLGTPNYPALLKVFMNPF